MPTFLNGSSLSVANDYRKTPLRNSLTKSEECAWKSNQYFPDAIFSWLPQHLRGTKGRSLARQSGVSASHSLDLDRGHHGSDGRVKFRDSRKPPNKKMKFRVYARTDDSSLTK